MPSSNTKGSLPRRQALRNAPGVAVATTCRAIGDAGRSRRDRLVFVVQRANEPAII